jgi:hypothetical protein
MAEVWFFHDFFQRHSLYSVEWCSLYEEWIKDSWIRRGRSLFYGTALELSFGTLGTMNAGI